jgi:hypothetical protein
LVEETGVSGENHWPVASIQNTQYIKVIINGNNCINIYNIYNRAQNGTYMYKPFLARCM